MKKNYIKPLIEVQTIEMESLLNSTSTVFGTNLDDLTEGTDKPTEFSKGHSSLWDFGDDDI